MTKSESALGCILGGAIGDVVGGVSERGSSSLSDDTQLTLATCESIVSTGRVDVEHLSKTFVSWFQERRITGIGSATLKAMRDLAAGAHWSLAGRRGEMAAGNGGAMRIAPLAFAIDSQEDRTLVRDVVRITHHSDEAYVGALAVLVVMQHGQGAFADWLTLLESELPDSRVRDRLLEFGELREGTPLEAAADRYGASGYVVETVPLALFSASRIIETSFPQVLDCLVKVGGDTDTIGSIAGQVAGARLGAARLPKDLVDALPDDEALKERATQFSDWVAAG